MTRRCSCGLDFTISESLQSKYKDNAMEVPKRCNKCRALRKGEDYESRARITDITEFENIPTNYYPSIHSGILDFSSYNHGDLFHGLIKFNQSACMDDITQMYELNKLSSIMTSSSIRTYEIRNTMYKNTNGVSLYVLHRFGQFYPSKQIILNELRDKYSLNTHLTFKNHFETSKSFINDDIWVDTANGFIFCFGEDKIRNLYTYLIESPKDLNTLSAEFHRAGTAKMSEIINKVNEFDWHNNEYIEIDGKQYSSDARSIITILVARETKFRNIKFRKEVKEEINMNEDKAYEIIAEIEVELAKALSSRGLSEEAEQFIPEFSNAVATARESIYEDPETSNIEKQLYYIRVASQKVISQATIVRNTDKL